MASIEQDMAYGGMQAGADIGGGVGGVLGGWLGGSAAENERRRIRGNLSSMRALYSELNPIVQAGYEDTYDVGPSAMEGVASELDPTLRSSQLQALRALMDVGTEGGMDPQSRAALMQANANAAREARAQQGALRQDFQSRGLGGGGLELGLRAAAGQQAANANAMAGVQAAADARARQIAALQSGAALAGNVRGADYGQAADRAQARDRVAELNARNRQDVQGRNIDRQYNAAQQTFQNRFARAGGEADALRANTEYQRAEEERRARQGYAAGGAIGSGLGAIGGAIFGGGK